MFLVYFELLPCRGGSWEMSQQMLNCDSHWGVRLMSTWNRNLNIYSEVLFEYVATRKRAFNYVLIFGAKYRVFIVSYRERDEEIF